MINISTLLKTISDAIYGEDMRSAIHDALEKVSNNAATDSDLQNEAAARQSADAALGNVKADKSYNSGFIGGTDAKLNAVGGVAIGKNAQASSGAAAGNESQASEGGAVGNGAYTSHGGSVGKDAYSMHGGAMGRNAKTYLGAAIGDGAQTMDMNRRALSRNPSTVDGLNIKAGRNSDDAIVWKPDGEPLSSYSYVQIVSTAAPGEAPTLSEVKTAVYVGATELNNGCFMDTDGNIMSGSDHKVGTDGCAAYFENGVLTLGGKLTINEASKIGNTPIWGGISGNQGNRSLGIELLPNADITINTSKYSGIYGNYGPLYIYGDGKLTINISSTSHGGIVSYHNEQPENVNILNGANVTITGTPISDGAGIMFETTSGNKGEVYVSGGASLTVDVDGGAITAIQLGKGINETEGSAKFFDYTIMNADGTIPHERIPLSINRYDVSALPSKSQTYDFSDGVSKFIAVERMDVAVESETQVMMSASNAGNKYGLAQFDFGSITDGATRIIAEYDTKYDGGRWEISLVDMSKRPGTSDKSSYDTAGVAFHTGTRDANNNFYLNGDNKYDTTLNNVWVHVRADIDLTAGTLKYEVSAEGALKYSGEIAVPESVGTIDGLEIYTWAQGTIYADNIKINALYDVDENGLYVTDEGQYIYKDGEPVRVGFDDLSGYYTKDEIDGKLESEDGGFKGGTSAQVMAGGAVGKEAIAENGAAVGYGAESMDGSATGSGAVTDAGGAAGSGANSLDGGAVGNTAQTDDGGAVGKNAQSSYGGAVGSGAKTGDGFAGGYEAKTTDSAGESIDAIQLGTGTNEIPKTLQIYDYRLMNADGTIPPERLNGDFYTKTETDTKIASAASDTVKYSDYPVHRFSVRNLMDKIDVLVPMIGLYEDHRFAPELTVQNKTSAPSSEVVPYGNTIQRYGEVSSMTIMMDGPYGAGDMYCGMVQFTSPAVPAEINVSGTPMFGVDCADGVFTPQANKRYTLKFVWDGLGYFGEVVGRPI